MLTRIAIWGLVLSAVSGVASAEPPVANKPSIPPAAAPAPKLSKAQVVPAEANLNEGKDGSPGVDRNRPQRLLHKKVVELDQLQREITQLRAATGTPQQILVNVQMLELALTKMQQMDVSTDWFANGIVTDDHLRKLTESISKQSALSTTASADQTQPNHHLFCVEWLKQNSLAKVLGEPTLVTASGRTASLHIGGEFPLPLGKDSDPPVALKKFGTEVEIQAVSLGDDQVRLKLGASLSVPDYGRAIEVDGVRIPALRTRRCASEVELSFGQTAMLTGPIERRTEARKNAAGQVEQVGVETVFMLVVTPESVPSANTPKVGKQRRRVR